MKHFSLTVLTLATCGVLLSGCQKNATQAEPQNQPVQTQNAQTGSSTTSLSDSELEKIAKDIENGKAYRCEMTNTEAGQVAEFIGSGKKIRMNSKTISDGKLTSEMISDGKVIYTWDPNTKKGMKFEVPSEQEQKELEQQAEQITKNMPSDAQGITELSDAGYTVDCDPTTVSDAQFVAPSDVEFQDFSAVMDSMMNSFGQQMSEEDRAKLMEQLNATQQ